MEKSLDISVDSKRVIRFQGRLCVPNDATLKKTILEEAHCWTFSIHSGTTKMCQNMKCTYCWMGMKRYVANFVPKCLIKVQCQLPSGLLTSLEVEVGMWDVQFCDQATKVSEEA